MAAQPIANIISNTIAKMIERGMELVRAIVKLVTGSTWEPTGPPPVAVEPAPTLPAVSLDEARDLINPMSRPLAEIANTISSNLAKMNQCLDILDKANNDEDRLKACLCRDVEVLRTTKLSSPRTVCTAKSCISDVNGVIEYSAVCHESCGISNVPHDTIGHPGLKNCSCMDSTDHCRVGNCRCSWQVHQHITYSTSRQVTQVIDESVQKQLAEKKSVKAIVESTLNQLAKEIQELEEEKNKIGTASAQFTVFLKEHAADGSFIDMIDQFLESMIDQRRHINQMDACNELEKLRKDYQDEMQLLEKTLQEEREERELLQKKLLEEKQAAASSSNSSSPASWIPSLGGLFNWGGQPAPPKAVSPQPFGRQPAPPKSIFGGLANLNPFSKSEPAPPPPKPLKLEDVRTLLAELEKLPRSGASLFDQLQAQK